MDKLKNNLLNTIVRMYLEDSKCDNALNYFQIDKNSYFIINENGLNSISSPLLFMYKYQNIVTDERIIKLYFDLLNSKVFINNCDNYIKELLSSYYIESYNKNNCLKNINYINLADFNSIKEEFIFNPDFGVEILKGFFSSLYNGKVHMQINYCDIIKDKNEDTLIKLDDHEYRNTNNFVNNEIRETIINTFNDLKYNASFSLHETLIIMKDYIIKNKFNFNNDEYIYFIKMVYADIYEYLLKMIDEDIELQDNEKRIYVVILTSMSLNLYGVPKDETLLQLLYLFISINNDEDLKSQNRKNTIKNNHIKSLELINPLYVVEKI